MNDYSVSIVIPTYNTWNLTESLAIQITQHESPNDFIFVDDGSTNRPSGFFYGLGNVVQLPMNTGFTIACNKGLKTALPLSSGLNHIIFLISNDVQINGKFIQQTADILLSGRKHLVGNRLINWDTGWNEFEGKVFYYLEGFFLAATSDGWRELGLFDERYAPYDMEDIDLSTKAKSIGYKLTSLNNPNIVHRGAGTLGYNPEREAITIRNKELFRKKWMRE